MPVRFPAVHPGRMAGMSSSALPLTEMPSPQYVMSAEGHRIATYTWGDDGAADTVFCVHGFASSTRDNWVNTGWVRDLTRAGYRVLAVDQRGHGASDKPHDPRDYTMPALVGDLVAVLDTYLLDEVMYAGYSLGGRVGWQLLVDVPHRVTRAVLGGIPDGRPLARVDIEQARAYIERGIPVQDKVTQNYVTLAERVPGNDLGVLVALAEGMRLGDADPDPERPPQQPVLFATGSEDAILERSRMLADATPHGRFVEIPDRHHFNAPGSRVLRQQALTFFGER
jgi:pimeloyl-ACP methyl ester carboxylesterase